MSLIYPNFGISKVHFMINNQICSNKTEKNKMKVAQKVNQQMKLYSF